MIIYFDNENDFKTIFDCNENRQWRLLRNVKKQQQQNGCAQS